MTIQYGDLATWVAAVGTVGALGTALWQIRTERNRRLAQEVHDRQERREEQARRIACWPGPRADTEGEGPMDPWWGSSTPIDLVNGSDEPVYNLVVAIVLVQGAGAARHAEDWKERALEQRDAPWSTAAILPPGRWRVWVPGTGWGGGMGLRLGAEVAFTDRAGVSWVRRSTGALQQLPKPPLEYFADFGLHGPYDLQVPQPVTGREP